MNALVRKDWTPPGDLKEWPLGKIALSSDEVQRYLGVQPERLRQWVARGRVARIGTDYDMGSILAYLWQRQQAGEFDS